MATLSMVTQCKWKNDAKICYFDHWRVIFPIKLITVSSIQLGGIDTCFPWDIFRLSSINTLYPYGIFLSLEVLSHFGPKLETRKIHKDFWTISSLYVLNCFKYFLIYVLGQNASKTSKKRFWAISSLCVSK